MMITIQPLPFFDSSCPHGLFFMFLHTDPKDEDFWLFILYTIYFKVTADFMVKYITDVFLELDFTMFLYVSS